MMALTAAARRSRSLDADLLDGVAGFADLSAFGVTSDHVAAQVAAGRWTRHGGAVVLHNGALTERQRQLVALLNCGPRAVLTSFTGIQRQGLVGWERPGVHVLAPAGTRRPDITGLVLHRTGEWRSSEIIAGRRLHRFGPALVIAASSFASARPACGLLAAGVQQRLIRPGELRRAVTAASRTRHRRALLLSAADIEGGAQALSEIDFARLCRHAGLPEPTRQAVRLDREGRRRYLDAEWRRPDGRRIAVEVDGALHLVAQRWWDDQLRQNEIVIAGTPLLRFPSAVVRLEPALVVDQLRRILMHPPGLDRPYASRSVGHSGS